MEFFTGVSAVASAPMSPFLDASNEEKMGVSEQDHPDTTHCPSSSSSASVTSLRERRLGSQHDSIHTELNPLHPVTLREEEYVLALIMESSPLHYWGLLLKSWWKEGSALKSSHGLRLKSKHRTPPKSPCLETSEDTASCQFRMSWTAVCSIIFLKTLLLFAKPFEFFGNKFEYYLNLMYLNHGLKRTLYTCLFNRGALKRPCNESEDYYCVTGLLDPRQELLVQEGILSDVENLESDAGMKSMADVCVMASKISYENAKVIKKVVEQEWKMNFVDFLDCWNDYLESKATQAFIFTDKKQDANIVVVAFRGTQPFNMYDWCTDFDFSYYVLPEIGRVHVGFLEALGLGSRLRRETLHAAKVNTIMKANKQTPTGSPTSGLSEQVIKDDAKVLAYDEISAKVQALLSQNPRAKLYITGHSLGGALATLFSALLFIEGNDTCSRLGGIFTFGQPRVGDAKFAKYMENKLCGSGSRKYFRVVFRTDVVPRVPFDDTVFQFKHISPCHYYMSRLESKALLEEPYKDLFSVALLPTPHFSAMKELCESIRSRFRRRGEGYVETGFAVVMRLWAMVCPGLCAHFPSCYVDAVRNAPSPFLLQAVDLEKRRPASSRSSIGSIAFTLPKMLRWSRSSSTHEHLH